MPSTALWHWRSRQVHLLSSTQTHRSSHQYVGERRAAQEAHLWRPIILFLLFSATSGITDSNIPSPLARSSKYFY